jgi:hypothetical protein
MINPIEWNQKKQKEKKIKSSFKYTFVATVFETEIIVLHAVV